MKDKRNNKKNSSYKSRVLLSVFIITIAIFMIYRMSNKEEQYLVNAGIIEYSTTGIGYVAKNETIIEIDTSKVLVPTISEGSRVSKNNIIATYRGSEYQGYQEKLKELDAEILLAMKDINIDYSIDISNLENQVINSVINSLGVSSMVEMQECKSNVDKILSRRASIVGELSPEDAYVKELIAKREKLEAEILLSESNIKAPIGGIISYTIDGLEEKLTEKTIQELNYEDVKACVKNKQEVSSNKIRVTSNYEAYILIRAENIDGDYINLEDEYELKIVGAELSQIRGKIIKSTPTEQGYEVLFRVTNGVENLIDIRECEVEVVWESYEGLVVPLKAIHKGDDGKKYVQIITRGDYIEIPVKVKQKNKTYAIVENYEKENINDYILERYDQVVISHK